MLARMAVGVLFAERRPTYDGTLRAQQDQAKQKLGKGDLAKLLRGGHTWEI